VSGRSVVHVRRSTSPLEVAEVRALQSAVRHERADGGLLFTTGGLGPQAYEYAHGRPLRMFDGHSVVVLCRQHDLPARIEPAPPRGRDALDTPHEHALPEQRHDRAPSSVDR
jgi:restriction system protein